jgi:hypothetical protein
VPDDAGTHLPRSTRFSDPEDGAWVFPNLFTGKPASMTTTSLTCERFYRIPTAGRGGPRRGAARAGSHVEAQCFRGH